MINRERRIPLRYLAWALPALYAIHLLEEYFAGERFPVWFSRVLNANLSDADFILINSFDISIFILAAILYTIKQSNTIMIVSLGAVLFINGFVHIFSSIFSLSYCPGTISGTLLYLPLGYFLFLKSSPPLTVQQRKQGLGLGALIHIVVAGIALTI